MLTLTRNNPIAVVLCEGRNVPIPMVTDSCACGITHDLTDQTLWYATRVRGNSENGFEPWCKAHDDALDLRERLVDNAPTLDTVRARIAA